MSFRDVINGMEVGSHGQTIELTSASLADDVRVFRVLDAGNTVIGKIVAQETRNAFLFTALLPNGECVDRQRLGSTRPPRTFAQPQEHPHEETVRPVPETNPGTRQETAATDHYR